MSAGRQTQACIHAGSACIINLGLLGPRHGKDTLTFDQRLGTYLKALPELLHPGYRVEVMLNNVPDDEPTLIVSGVFRAIAQHSLLFWDLLVTAEQDCCSIYYPGLHFGVLFGPNAVEWGEFNKQAFKMPVAKLDDYPTMH